MKNKGGITGKDGESSFRLQLFSLVDQYAEFIVKKRGFQKMKLIHAKLAAFLALPDTQKSLSQGDFSRHYKCGINAPTEWKARSDVMKAREVILYEHARKWTPLVLENLANSAQRKNWNTGMADA